MMPDYCDICDRDTGDIPAEVRAFAHGVCLQCWLDSVTDGIHNPEVTRAKFRLLLPRPRAAEV